MLEGMERPKLRFQYCKIQTIAAGLSDTDAKILLEAVENVALWPANTLSRELSKRGISIADVTIAKHRQRACVCFRD